VGTIKGLIIQSDEQYAGSAWDLEWVIIKKNGDPHSYVFQCHTEIGDTGAHGFDVSEVRN
jgi:hypothetical protein